MPMAYSSTHCSNVKQNKQFIWIILNIALLHYIIVCGSQLTTIPGKPFNTDIIKLKAFNLGGNSRTGTLKRLGITLQIGLSEK